MGKVKAFSSVPLLSRGGCDWRRSSLCRLSGASGQAWAVDEAEKSALSARRHPPQIYSAQASNFWSSTENNSNNAWYQNLSSGSQNNNNKNNNNYVRCVRS